MRPRPPYRILLTLAVVLLTVALRAPFALADGDPASDVLATQDLFLPQDGGLTVRQQVQLGALLSSAGRSGFQLRLAIIATPTDLGSVTELWRQPQNYARFLGQELSLVYRGAVLVVMPNGFGLDAPTSTAAASTAAAQGSALGQLRSSAPGSRLGPAAILAVQRVAAAAGHPVRVSAVTAGVASPGTGYGPLAALVLGGLMVAIAWAASLRARPLRAGGDPGP